MAHLLGLWMMATTIAASPSDIGIKLNYEVPTGCPSASIFLNQVKTAYGKDAEVAASSVSIKVTRNEKYLLELLQEDETRRLEDESCAAVIEAAALIVGLWLSNRPEKRTAPIRPIESNLVAQESAHSIDWRISFSTAQEISFDDSQDFRTSLGIDLGLKTADFQFRLGVSGGLPQVRRYPFAEEIGTTRWSTRLEAQAGLKIFSDLEAFSALHFELLQVKAEELNNPQSVLQPAVYGGLGLSYSVLITNTWGIFAQSSGIVSLYSPRFLIDNLGEVPVVPLVRLRGKIGTEIHF